MMVRYMKRATAMSYQLWSAMAQRHVCRHCHSCTMHMTDLKSSRTALVIFIPHESDEVIHREQRSGTDGIHVIKH